MSIATKIQWCDSTCNPTMGCEGCELWTGDVKKCYAGTLHVRFGGTSTGYADTFEDVTLFPGRMEEASRWADLTGTDRPDKPWLNGYPRLIFVSDMSDSMSSSVGFDYLEEEVVDNVASTLGSRHQWSWLTKRPERMEEEIVEPKELSDEIDAVFAESNRHLTRPEVRLSLLLRGYFARLTQSEINKAIGAKLKEGVLFSSTGKTRINDTVQLSDKSFL